MLLSSVLYGLGLVSAVAGTILQNGQVRETNYPNTQVNLEDGSYEAYDSHAKEITYLGRWDSKKISYWA